MAGEVHGTPIAVGPTPPLLDEWQHSGSGEYFHRWYDTTNRVWKSYNGSEWVAIGEIGMNLAHDGDKMEITKLTVVGGIITELEYTT